MKLKTILLQGELNEPIKLKIGLIEAINKGLWEICLSSVSFIFKKRCDFLLTISSNYVQGPLIQEDGTTSIQPVTLSVIQCRGISGQKKLIAYKCRDYFEINNAQQTLEIYFKNAETGESLVDQNASAIVFLNLRRKA